MQRYTFWSNSQLQQRWDWRHYVVRANAKIHILKQFTTELSNYCKRYLLYVLMQRYTFWSNSQQIIEVTALMSVVRANAKIHILKQFTTALTIDLQALPLYVLMQRYTFWSNSQPNQANRIYKTVVRANAKIHNLKQFTTNYPTLPKKKRLYVLMQRYTFWSNSQRCVIYSLISVSCTC